jgi:hypothetical protein
MTPDKLAQALIAQKMASAETDKIDIISRALEVPREMLLRVFYAQSCLGLASGHLDWSVLLPDEELRDAIQKAMKDGYRRLVVATAIRDGRSLTIRTRDLLTKAQAPRLCHGCPERLDCTAGSLYTPDECYEERKTSLPVFPLRMTETQLEVETSQPAGKFTIRLTDVHVEKNT